MPPKKAAGGATKKAPSTHGTYKDMIKVAIIQLKDRTGSSRQAIKKYVKANNNLGNTTDAALSNHINSAIANGVKTGDFLQPKGPSGTVKLAKKAAAAPKAAKKPAAKKPTTVKKTSTVKKTVVKKTPATKTKANVAKPRKAAPKKAAPAAAPAVETKKPVVVGKTKSGRVTKSSADPAVAKKVAGKGKRQSTGKKAKA